MAPRPNSTPEEILKVTFELVAEHDISGVSVDMVAAKAGVSKATIYRRWPSRSALIVEAMTRLRRPLTNPDTGSLRGDLTILLTELVKLFDRSETSRVFASFLNASVRDPELSALQKEIEREARARYERVIKRGIERGELGADINLRFLIDILLAPFLYQGIVEHTKARKRDIEPLIDMVLIAYGKGQAAILSVTKK